VCSVQRFLLVAISDPATTVSSKLILADWWSWRCGIRAISWRGVERLQVFHSGVREFETFSFHSLGHWALYNTNGCRWETSSILAP
jgi:hypothetical protein